MVDDRNGNGGRRGSRARSVIVILLLVAAVAAAFAVFGRRSGEGKKDPVVGTAAVLTGPQAARSA